MSEERRRRQEERTQPPAGFPWRKIGTAVVIVAAFGVAYYLGWHKKVSRYDNFARCLSEKKATMYGLYWCPHCKDQEELFGTSFQYVTYVECGIRGARGEQPACQQANIKNFPTWQFASGERKEGTLSLRELGAKTGCSLP